MPSAHLFVNLGGPARLLDSDPSVPPAVLADGWFMGVWTRRFLVEYPARVRLLGVHFKPWGISPFAGLPATELRDRWVPVDAVWPRSLDRIRNQAGDSASATGTLRVLEQELRSRLAQAPPRGLGLVRRAGGRLEASRGAVPVGALTEAAGVVSAAHPGGFGPGGCADRSRRGERHSPGRAVQVAYRGHPEA